MNNLNKNSTKTDTIKVMTLESKDITEQSYNITVNQKGLFPVPVIYRGGVVTKVGAKTEIDLFNNGLIALDLDYMASGDDNISFDLDYKQIDPVSNLGYNFSYTYPLFKDYKMKKVKSSVFDRDNNTYILTHQAKKERSLNLSGGIAKIKMRGYLSEIPNYLQNLYPNSETYIWPGSDDIFQARVVQNSSVAKLGIAYNFKRCDLNIVRDKEGKRYEGNNYSRVSFYTNILYLLKSEVGRTKYRYDLLDMNGTRTVFDIAVTPDFFVPAIPFGANVGVSWSQNSLSKYQIIGLSMFTNLEFGFLPGYNDSFFNSYYAEFSLTFGIANGKTK
ncbi:MAG: hypothetical protein ACPGU5_03325 [Lishizhenia sp.]